MLHGSTADSPANGPVSNQSYPRPGPKARDCFLQHCLPTDFANYVQALHLLGTQLPVIRYKREPRYRMPA